MAACSCARNTDGTTTALLCPLHSDVDPCASISRVTGRRRTGSIRRGCCTACGWTDPSLRPHVYSVGLPVLIEVHPDGRVTYSVDLSEASRERGGVAAALLERDLAASLDGRDPSEIYTDEEVEADSRAIHSALQRASSHLTDPIEIA